MKETSSTVSDKGLCFYPPTELYQILFPWSETSLRTQFFFATWMK